MLNMKYEINWTIDLSDRDFPTILYGRSQEFCKHPFVTRIVQKGTFHEHLGQSQNYVEIDV